MSALPFELPPGLEAHEPAEARGLSRDSVRLLVTDRAREEVVHARFHDLPQFVAPGDLLVVNTSATLAAALAATREDGLELELRLSTPARRADSDGEWIVELRRGEAPFDGVQAGDRFELPGGATAQILEPFAAPRLWLARLDLPQPLEDYLAAHGQPIRYGYVPRAGRCRRTRTSTRASPAAPRWRAPGGRSRPS